MWLEPVNGAPTQEVNIINAGEGIIVGGTGAGTCSYGYNVGTSAPSALGPIYSSFVDALDNNGTIQFVHDGKLAIETH